MTIRVRSTLCLAFLVAACGENRPAPPTAPTPGPDIVLSGTVYEHGPFGRRPLSGVPLDITEQQPWVRRDPQYVSDADGRYRFEIQGWQVPRGGYPIRVRAAAPAYRQPCRVQATLTADTTLDVHLVPDSILSTSGVPPSMPIAEPRLVGRILDRTGGSEKLIAGAAVAGEFGYDGSDTALDDATTRTNAAGEYMLCGLPPAFWLVASAPGYRSARAEVGSAPIHDIELTPR